MPEPRWVPHAILLRLGGALPLVALAMAFALPRILSWSMEDAKNMIPLWQILAGIGAMLFVLALLIRRPADSMPMFSLIFGAVGVLVGGILAVLGAMVEGGR
jgi:hypothetical protein